MTHSMLRISQAASLALHTMVFLAERPGERLSTRQIAETLRSSGFHLAKVLQRLNRAGLVESVRGPQGGFKLRPGWEEITLLQVYEAVEGSLDPSPCIAGDPVCTRSQCIMGDLTRAVNRQVRAYLEGTRLRDLTCVSPDTTGGGAVA